MNWKVLLASAFVVVLLEPETLRGTTPPETHPLEPLGPAQPAIDPNLQAWLDQHVEQPSPFDLSGEAFAAYLRKQDAAAKVYLGLAFAAKERDEAATKQAVDAAWKRLSGSDAAELESHPLMPFIWLELLNAREHLSPEQAARATAGMMQAGAGSCAQKKLTYDEITKENLAALSDDGLRELIRRVDSFRSQVWRRNATRKLVAALPDNRQGAVAEPMLSLAQSYPALVGSTPWLKALVGAPAKAGAPRDETKAVKASFDEARQISGKKQCSKAKNLILDGLKIVKAQKLEGTLDDAVNAAKAVDGCYRKRDRGLRRDFWTALTATMQDTYGFAGWAEAKIRLGHIHWSANDFNEARAALAEVVQKAAEGKGKHKEFEARAIFALGRIHENEGDIDKAIVRLKDYVSRFPDLENFEEAMMALSLLLLDKNDWVGALGALEPYIAQQTEKPLDERSVGGMSFALFWAGRIYLEQGNKPLAEEMWRRVTSEFYSTYYGAMGHYLLERATGKKYALQPSRAPAFRMTTLREALPPQDRVRVARVEHLMRLGLHSDAVCELEEIDTADGKPEKLLLRSVMLFAAGRWLEAIKAYDALPRGFRSGLPVGFERILFPQRYADQIRAFAKKADVDADLVMAVIRQESVFNPLAKSPVGAMGLMQLMPATAKLEMKRIAGHYLTPEERTTIRNRVHGNITSLLGPETNLAIGVHHLKSLLDKYGSPVYVLSAYNASPSAAVRWMNNIPTKDILSFIERIPYKETRAYVKLVLRNYFYYKRWYGDPSEALTHIDNVASKLLASVTPEAKAAAGVASGSQAPGPSGPTATPPTLPGGASPAMAMPESDGESDQSKVVDAALEGSAPAPVEGGEAEENPDEPAASGE